MQIVSSNNVSVWALRSSYSKSKVIVRFVVIFVKHRSEDWQPGMFKIVMNVIDPLLDYKFLKCSNDRPYIIQF